MLPKPALHLEHIAKHKVFRKCARKFHQKVKGCKPFPALIASVIWEPVRLKRRIYIFELNVSSVENSTDPVEYTTEVRPDIWFKRRVLHVPSLIHKLCLIIFYP